jgi:hypothetical protein
MSGPIPPFTCRFCGQPSWVDPSDQTPPADCCHQSDHGESDEEGVVHPRGPSDAELLEFLLGEFQSHSLGMDSRSRWRLSAGWPFVARTRTAREFVEVAYRTKSEAREGVKSIVENPQGEAIALNVAQDARSHS